MVIKELNNNWTCSSVREGAIFTENLSSELDSATLVLSMVDEISIEPYDVVKIENGSQTIYMLVASYTKSYISFNPVKYDYTLNLMSLTKLLETIQLPSMTCTNIGQDRTIGTYIANAIKYFNYDGLTITSNDIPVSLTSRICPEFTITTPTLREFLDYLLGIGGYIAKLDYSNGFKLSYLDLNKNDGIFNTTYVETLECGNSSESYVSDLVSYIDKAIGQDSITEHIEFRTNEYAFTTDNATLLLTHNIYDIESFKVTCMVSFFNYSGASDTDYVSCPIEVDLTKHIVSKDVWESLPTLTYQQLTSNSSIPGYVATMSKNTCLYFERGSNEIFNTLDRESYQKVWLTDWSYMALEYAIRAELNDKIVTYVNKYNTQNPNNTITYVSGCYAFNSPHIQNIDQLSGFCFEVKYKPYISQKVLLEQLVPHRHNVSMNNNSSDAMVNLSSFIKSSIENMNQLGNEQMGFTGYGATNGTPFTLGGKFNDYIVTKIEKTIHNNKILYKGLLSKYFSNKNIYTTLDRTKRYTSLANDDVVNRCESFKDYIYVSESTATINSGLDYEEVVNTMTKQCGYAQFYCHKADDETVVTGAMYPTVVKGGNSINYSIEFPSNIYYGLLNGEVSNAVTNKADKFRISEYQKYVDDYGEATNFKVWFLEKPLTPFTVYHTSLYSQFVKTFPVVNSDITIGQNQFAYTKYDILKDSRERLNLSISTIFKSTSNKIIIGIAFTDLTEISKHTFKYVSKSSNYTYSDQYTISSGTTFIPAFDTSNCTLSLPSGMTNGNNYGVYNENGQLVFAYNNVDRTKYIAFSKNATLESIPYYAPSITPTYAAQNADNTFEVNVVNLSTEPVIVYFNNIYVAGLQPNEYYQFNSTKDNYAAVVNTLQGSLENLIIKGKGTISLLDSNERDVKDIMIVYTSGGSTDRTLSTGSNDLLHYTN